MNDEQVFGKIVQHAKTVRTLESVLEILNWDQETVMPPAAHAHRTEQQALIAGLIHQKKCEASYRKNIQNVKCSGDEAIIVDRLHKDITKAQKLPEEFVQAFTRATSNGFEVWQTAKATNNWKLFCPHLERIVELIRQKIDYYGYKDHPYDAILDDFEPEMTTQEVSSIFTPLKDKLLHIISQVKQSHWYGKNTPIASTLEQQLQISKNVLSFIGFDWNKGRLDTSEHPFSVANHPTDARVTVRRDTNDLLEQVMSALHEGGHALYDMGLCQEHYGTPLAQPTSYSIHESQSRFWEIQIGRSKAFSKHLLKILHTGCNPKALPQSSDELYNALNRVECSPIRTQADDCTYPLHVIVRFEIEKDLITGNLKVSDLPERWNSEMEKLLGIRPKTHTEGCLQDVHWSLGSFGYFPTYTLGSLFAVCLFNAMKDAIPTLEEGIEQGQFSHIHSWLQENVWQHGRRYTSRQLIMKATGKAPTENDYIAYLQAKYL